MTSVQKQMDIRKFPLENIKPGSLIANVGKRGSGKSFLTRNFLYKMRDKVPLIVIFSSTENVNAFYKDFVPDSFIHTELNEDRIKAIYNGQKDFITKNRAEAKRKGRKYKEHTFNDNLLIIVDDFMHKKSMFNHEVLKDIFFNGRHSNITFLLNIQYTMLLPTEYRSQIDIAFLYHEPIHANKKRLYEYYAGMFSTFREFENVFKKLTENWECMVIKMTNTDAECASGGVENMVFWYKAEQTPKFKIGHKILWNHHKTWNVEKKAINVEEAREKKNSKSRTIRIV